MNDGVVIDWNKVYSEIEDLLIPGLGLDAWDRALYYHLLRHTRLKGKDSAMFAIGPLSKATAISDIKVREVIRALHHKGCLRIEDRSRRTLPPSFSRKPQLELDLLRVWSILSFS